MAIADKQYLAPNNRLKLTAARQEILRPRSLA